MEEANQGVATKQAELKIRTGVISLTPSDVALAMRVGEKRNLGAHNRGYANQHGLHSSAALTVHHIGACGEIAFCRLQGIEWPESVDTYKSIPDVECFEVRTRFQPWHELIVRKDDADDAPFVLVNVIDWPTKFRVTGWIYGRDAKQRKWIHVHGGREEAYFVPQGELNDSILKRQFIDG